MKFGSILIAGVLLTGAAGCATAPAVTPLAELRPSEGAEAPTPIEGNTGKYMSPYTTDEVVAEWVDKAISAKMGASIGSAAGRYAGEKAMENIPFVGGFLGKSVGESVGRRVALEAVGGEAFMRETSDISFNSLNELALFLFVEHSQRENFQDVLSATSEIYPELETVYAQVARQAAS